MPRTVRDQDADSLVASFGVLCAQRSVACDAPAVSHIFERARTVKIVSLRGAGAGVTTRTTTRSRMTGVRLEAFESEFQHGGVV